MLGIYKAQRGWLCKVVKSCEASSGHSDSASCSTRSSLCRWFNLFTSTCFQSCVCCSLVAVFRLLFTGFFIVSLSHVLLSKWHLYGFFLASIVFLRQTFIKALAHMHNFLVALFHHRNRGDPRKVCLTAVCGFPSPSVRLISGLLLFLTFTLAVGTTHSATRGDFF